MLFSIYPELLSHILHYVSDVQFRQYGIVHWMHGYEGSVEFMNMFGVAVQRGHELFDR